MLKNQQGLQPPPVSYHQPTKEVNKAANQVIALDHDHNNNNNNNDNNDNNNW